jgi:hypothetical protein
MQRKGKNLVDYYILEGKIRNCKGLGEFDMLAPSDVHAHLVNRKY